MQIQVNTDRNIEGHEKLTNEVQAHLEQSLNHYNGHITRLEVHLSDTNGDKSGPDDKRCKLEARVAGLQPMLVDHSAADVMLAVSGASDKMRRALETTLGKLGRR